MKYNEAKRIMQFVADDDLSSGRAIDGQNKAARVMLKRIETLEKRCTELKKELASWENSSPEELGEMLAGL